jgi:hypothetical protein
MSIENSSGMATMQIQYVPSVGYQSPRLVTVEKVRETKTLVIVRLPGSGRELRLSKVTEREVGADRLKGGYWLLPE